MTIQSPEKIIYNSAELYTAQEPLESIANRVGFVPFLASTGLKRGYVATWEIARGNLYLKGVEIPFYKGDGLHKFFPGCKERVFSKWFNGSIEAYDKFLPLQGGMSGVSERLQVVVEEGVVLKEVYCKVYEEDVVKDSSVSKFNNEVFLRPLKSFLD